MIQYIYFMIWDFKDQYQFKSKLLGAYNKSKTCSFVYQNLVYKNYYIYPTILQLIDSYLSLKYSVFIRTISIY